MSLEREGQDWGGRGSELLQGAGAGGSTGSLTPKQVAAQQRQVLIRIMRLIFVILIVTFTTLGFYQIWGQSRETNQNYWLPIITAALIIIIVVGIDILTPVKRISSIVGVLVGLFFGIIATLVVSGLFDLLLQSWTPQLAYDEWRPMIQSVKIVVGICFGYLGVITVLQTQDDFRLVIPYVEFSKQIRGVRPIVLDSSALIDGRIADLVTTRFIQAPLVVPQFVVQELQMLSDSSDGLKRARGRRGLDMITRLQRSAPVDVSIDESPVPGTATDQMLVELARTIPAMILTTDAGLSRVAAIQGVLVLNLNDLANAAKVNLAPGELVSLRVLRAGEQAGQGVGYLPDGTMIVVEDGGRCIGETVQATVTSSLQTTAGRLIFARIGLPERSASPTPSTAHVGAPSVTTVVTTPAPIPAAGLGASVAAAPSRSESADEGNVATADGPAASGPAVDSGQATGSAASVEPATRGPFPPKAPQALKHGSPRNPRR